MADNNIVGAELTMSLDEAKILVMRGMKGDPGESPRINPENNHWEVYDNDTEQWVDTGVNARGPKGDPGSGEGGGSLPEVDSSDVGKVLRVNSDVEWDVLDPPTGVPNYSGAHPGSVLKLYRPSANSGNAMTWGSAAYQIHVTSSGGVYTVDSAVTADDISANRGNLVIILNNTIEYDCVGALTSGFYAGHFYFVVAKPSSGKIESEWLDLEFHIDGGTVSVTPFHFDVQNTTYIEVLYNSTSGTYSTNKTAAQIVAALPNAAAWLGEAKYSPAGWNLDEGYLVDATFIRGIRLNNFAVGLDCIRFVNDGGVTVERFTLTPNAHMIPVQYGSGDTLVTTATGRDVYDHLDNCAIAFNNLLYYPIGAMVSGPYGWVYFASFDPTGSDKIEGVVIALRLVGENTACEVTQYDKDIPLLPSVSSSDNGKILIVDDEEWVALDNPTLPFNIYARWDSGTSTYQIKKRNSQGSLVDATYDDLYDHRNHLWLDDRLPIDFITTSGDLVAGQPDFTCYFTERLVYSDRVEYTQWKISVADSISVTRTTKTLS